MTRLPDRPAGSAVEMMSAGSAENLRLLGQDDLAGHGMVGEGLSVQRTADGRRILWVAHECAPVDFSGLDVTDPRAMRLVAQTMLPHAEMRSNSLDVVGDILVVAYQTARQGMQPAGFGIYDVSVPEAPRRIGFFDCSGPQSRGVHQLWFVDGRTVHMSAGAADFEPQDARDDQFYRAVDISDPTRPHEVSRWWLPGTRKGDAAPPPRAGEATPSRFCRVHNTNVYPQRPDRAYLGYLDSGAILLDIADPGRPRQIARWDNSPPMVGFTHTVLPLFSRDLWVVTDESIVDGAVDWPKLVWILDARSEEHPLPIATLPIPPPAMFAMLGGRYGAHNIHENQPTPCSLVSETLIFGTYFRGGLRVHDIADPFRPTEIAHFVPPPDPRTRVRPQINDVFVDDRGVIFAADRVGGGIFALELEKQP